MVMTLKTQLNYQDGDLSGANEMNQNGLGLWSQRGSLMLTSSLFFSCMTSVELDFFTVIFLFEKGRR